MGEYNLRGERTPESLLRVCREGYLAWEESVRRGGKVPVRKRLEVARLDSVERAQAEMLQ